MISFQKYGKEKYHCNSVGTGATFWDLDVSFVPFKPGEINIHDSNTFNTYVKNIPNYKKNPGWHNLSSQSDLIQSLPSKCIFWDSQQKYQEDKEGMFLWFLDPLQEMLGFLFSTKFSVNLRLFNQHWNRLPQMFHPHPSKCAIILKM